MSSHNRFEPNIKLINWTASETQPGSKSLPRTEPEAHMWWRMPDLGNPGGYVGKSWVTEMIKFTDK
jgi:hypothetical protein